MLNICYFIKTVLIVLQICRQNLLCLVLELRFLLFTDIPTTNPLCFERREQPVCCRVFSFLNPREKALKRPMNADTVEELRLVGSFKPVIEE